MLNDIAKKVLQLCYLSGYGQGSRALSTQSEVKSKDTQRTEYIITHVIMYTVILKGR
jgi:hypothetical protein